MQNYMIIIMNTETLELYPVERRAMTPKMAIKLVKLEDNEKVDAVYVEVKEEI